MATIKSLAILALPLVSLLRFQSWISVALIFSSQLECAEGFSPSAPLPPVAPSSGGAAGDVVRTRGVNNRLAPPRRAAAASFGGRDDSRATFLKQQISADDQYYGGFDSSYIVREFSLYEQLEDIVDLASKPLPERPDGIVAVAKFTSAERPDCRAAEASYERLARDNPATIFLRTFKEMEGSDALFQRARAEVLPCFDVFYMGNRVARVEGPRYAELEAVINQYQMLNSDLDLFSESANESRQAAWGQGGSSDFSKTPRTTASFIPGYDWNKKGGFFDELATDLQKNTGFDFEKSYEDDWMPKIDD